MLEILKSDMEPLLFDILIPKLVLTQKDYETFYSDPEEFIRKEEDVSDMLYNLRNISMEVIEKICEIKDKNYLIDYVKFIAICLQTNINPRSN